MTEISSAWDGVLIGDASQAPYSSAEWATREKLLQGQGVSFPNYGVLRGTGDGTYEPLTVNAKTPASTNIEVEIGAALVVGYLYQNTAALTFTVGANASGNPRIDTVVLRMDVVGQTVRAVVKQGTPAGSPVAPTMQQDASFWEIPLADIAVANGFAVINQTNITNRQRTLQSLSGSWQHVANPVQYAPGVSYDGTSILVDGIAHTAVAVPFVLGASMLLQEVQIRHLTSVLASYIINWGLYVQDTNDGLVAEHTLRRVATGGATGSTGGSANITLPATPTPQIIPPGAYWLVIIWAGGSAAGLSLGAVAASTFDLAAAHLETAAIIAGGTPPQTINLSTYSGALQPVAARLRGRVFGMTTVV